MYSDRFRTGGALTATTLRLYSSGTWPLISPPSVEPPSDMNCPGENDGFRREGGDLLEVGADVLIEFFADPLLNAAMRLALSSSLLILHTLCDYKVS